jgi:outer membrane immunogenic protein
MMKKLNLFVLFAVGFMFLAQTGFAQRPIYVVGGVQTAWISGSSSWSSGLIGGQAGVGMHIANLNEHLGFLGELNYSMQGSNWEEDFGEGVEKGHVSASYLNLPLVLRYMFGSDPAAGLFGELGLQPGFLLSAEDHWSGGSEDFKDQMNSFDLGIPVGVGYQMKGNLGVGLRYIYGLTNINSGDGDSFHNNVLALRVTWTFNKK